MGKQTKPYHYMNESRLLNEVLTGAFKGSNRDQLSVTELELVTLVDQGRVAPRARNRLCGSQDCPSRVPWAAMRSPFATGVLTAGATYEIGYRVLLNSRGH
jgi:hypothetical protein